MICKFLTLAISLLALYAGCDNLAAETTEIQEQLFEAQKETKEQRRKLNMTLQRGLKYKQDAEQTITQHHVLPNDARLEEGQNIPFYSPISKIYVRNIYVRAKFEEGSEAAITIDRNNYPHAMIVHENKLNLLLNNGNYELLGGKLYRLPPQHYHLTNDRSMLLSVYNGRVINYLPRIAILNEDFQPFTLDR